MCNIVYVKEIKNINFLLKINDQLLKLHFGP